MGVSEGAAAGGAVQRRITTCYYLTLNTSLENFDVFKGYVIMTNKK